MSKRGLLATLRDAGDILKHARPAEVARALVPGGKALRVLNQGAATAGENDDDALTRLAALRRRLQAEVLAGDGRVDYRRLAGSAIYAELEATSRALVGARLDFAADPAGRSAACTAFWINVYNVLTIHGVVALGIRRSIMEIPTFFGRVAYRVGGHVLTLDDIENGVLRRNSPHPVTGRRLFAAGDPRAALSPATIDPRIHAALVCGARSCPPIAMYDADRLDAQLTVASESLIANLELDEGRRTITLPLVLAWYQGDFGGAAGQRAWILAHAGQRRDAIERAFTTGWRVEHARYDWTLNEGQAPW